MHHIATALALMNATRQRVTRSMCIIISPTLWLEMSGSRAAEKVWPEA
jgi:hypothetical protein